MRFTPASILLASALALTASSSIGKKTQGPAPLSAAAKSWMERGATALEDGKVEAARGAYETALLLAPGSPDIYFQLGTIARKQKLPGKAIKYFDDVLRLDAGNQLALQAEGLAMMDKGATASARKTLEKLKELCKSHCAVAEPLAAAIAAGPPKFAAADETAPGSKTPPVDKP